MVDAPGAIIRRVRKCTKDSPIAQSLFEPYYHCLNSFCHSSAALIHHSSSCIFGV
jgi:hypothetical protein